ncbi:MAG: hypothetical protein ACM37W_03345 [Actinomycetota bacterium]
MGIKLKSLSGVLAVAVASTVLVSAKVAQAEPFTYHPISDQFNEAFFSNSGDYINATSPLRPAADFLGIGSRRGGLAFPEREIERDASSIHGLYREIMQQQVSSDPIIRVPDLANPFSTSVMTLPPSNVSLPPGGQ